MLSIIKVLVADDITIANELNKQRVPTFRLGAQWHATSVQNLLGRIRVAYK
jgi:hypothetical protein